MRLIVNTNRIIAALLKDSAARYLLFHADAEFLTITFSEKEVTRCKEYIMKKAQIAPLAFNILLDRIHNRLIQIDDRIILARMNEAQQIMDSIDPDDTPFIAAALATGTDIWSDDAHFQQQRRIKIWQTKDLVQKYMPVKAVNLKTVISEQELEELKTLAKKTDWYRQAGKIKPVYVITPCFGAIDEFSCPVIECYEAEFEGYYALDGLNTQARKWFRKTRKGTAAIDAYCAKLKKIFQKIKIALAAAERIDFRKAGKKRIASIITRLDTLNREMWRNCFLPDKFDPEGDFLLRQEVKKHNSRITQEEINILVRPQELNFIEESNKELAKTALVLIKKRSSDYATALKPFVKKYYFIQNNWESVKNVSEKDFVRPLKELLEQGAERVEKLHSGFDRLGAETKQKCEELCEKYAIPKELKNVFHLFRTLAMIRDQRKEYVLQFNHFYEQAVERCATEFRLAKELLYTTAPTELVHLLETGNIDIALLKERGKSAIWFKRKKQDFIIGGSAASEIMGILHKKLLEKYETLKGMIACKGSGGIIRGTVKIILGETHFTKFNAGDILVAAMTRPEYVPLMKKAKAIITDEGGITCHAAIVSRELGVPCLIGTQVSTKKLQDNCEVEIDVEKGTVRICE